MTIKRHSQKPRLLKVIVFFIVAFAVTGNVFAMAEDGSPALNKQQKQPGENIPTLQIVGIPDTVPWSYEENGVIKGVDYEFLQEIARRAGFKVSFKFIPFKRALQYLMSGNCDGILQIYYKKDREVFLHYPQEPIHFTEYKVFVKKDNLFEFNTINDLTGKKIGKNAGFAISPEFDKAVKEGKLNVQEAATWQMNLKKLHIGRIDAFVSNYATAMHEIKKSGLANELIDLPRPILTKKVYLAFSKKGKNIPDKDFFFKRIDTVMREIKTDGTLSKIRKNYLQ